MTLEATGHVVERDQAVDDHLDQLPAVEDACVRQQSCNTNVVHGEYERSWRELLTVDRDGKMCVARHRGHARRNAAYHTEARHVRGSHVLGNTVAR